MSHQNTWEENGLYRVFTDTVTGEEILTSNLSIHGDYRFDDIKYVINDFTRAVEFEAAELDILKISTIDNVAARSNSYLKIAIVVKSESQLNWVHQYQKQMRNSPLKCEIFGTVNEAYEWVSKSLSSA